MPCIQRCERNPHVIYPERFCLDRITGRNPSVIIIIKKFLKDETAATAIEYGLIAAGIALAIIAVVNGLGSKLGTKFTAINTSLK
jgi:pilus assembly protein Flp/PilA